MLRFGRCGDEVDGGAANNNGSRKLGGGCREGADRFHPRPKFSVKKLKCAVRSVLNPAQLPLIARTTSHVEKTYWSAMTFFVRLDFAELNG